MSETPTDPAECAPPPPGPEHQELMSRCGTWNVECRYFMDPSQPPMETTAVETVEPFGPYVVRTHFQCDMMGMPFEGSCTIGYSPKGGGWQATWVDFMSPHIFFMTGAVGDDGVLEMTCEGPAMMGDGMAQFKTREWGEDDGSRRFEMYTVVPGAGDVKMFEYRYTRAD